MSGRNRAARIQWAGDGRTTGIAGSTSTNECTSSGARAATWTPIVPPIEFPMTTAPPSCSSTAVTRRAFAAIDAERSEHAGPAEADQVDRGDRRAEAVGERPAAGSHDSVFAPSPWTSSTFSTGPEPSTPALGCHSTAWMRTPSTSRSYERPGVGADVHGAEARTRSLASWRTAHRDERSHEPGEHHDWAETWGFECRGPTAPASSPA